MSPSGIIIASTNANHIGSFHEIGYQACQLGKTLEVQEDNLYEGTQKGINIPFQYHGNTIGVIGITGEPEAVRKYGHLALRIMHLLLKERELEASRERNSIRSYSISDAIILRASTRQAAEKCPGASTASCLRYYKKYALSYLFTGLR
ncbi:MAG: hypothetical protein J6D38_08820 [Solobacterium sp.]|nr:hypothetical protein [Solobacterium sp.]